MATSGRSLHRTWGNVPFLLLLLFAPCWSAAQQADPADDSDIAVNAYYDGDIVRIEVSLYVGVSPREVWAVITDYDNATKFISDLEYSHIEVRDADAIYVHQKGTAKLGPLRFPVESYRKIQLFPFARMETRLISGTMKKMDGRILLKTEGPGTRITNRTELIPDFWLPPFIGLLFVEYEARAKFGELRREMLRRKAG